MPDPTNSRSRDSNTVTTKTFDLIDGKVRDDLAGELRAERDYYRATLQVIAQHDWQEIGAKGERYTLAAVAELIDTARRALDA